MKNAERKQIEALLEALQETREQLEAHISGKQRLNSEGVVDLLNRRAVVKDLYISELESFIEKGKGFAA